MGAARDIEVDPWVEGVAVRAWRRARDDTEERAGHGNVRDPKNVTGTDLENTDPTTEGKATGIVLATTAQRTRTVPAIPAIPTPVPVPARGTPTSPSPSPRPAPTDPVRETALWKQPQNRARLASVRHAVALTSLMPTTSAAVNEGRKWRWSRSPNNPLAPPRTP